MPTTKRISAPGTIAHIMARGINGADIFADDADRRHFPHQWAVSLEKTGYRYYGWALLLKNP